MATLLTVNINRQHLGKIILEESGERYALKYAQSWLDGGGFSVSPHLKPGECASESVRRFLANLLPEGRWLEELAISSHISRANIFGLVAAIGAETTGSLTFRLGDLPSEGPETSFRPVTAVELAERISQRQNVSIALWDGKPRLSVAGVQEKLPLLIRADGQMGFGEGELASTHILKFGTARALHLVINEYVCMQLARIMKLSVADVSLARFGEPVLVVRRFDRELTGDTVVRRHLIDGCQMLDLPPTYKYERPFGKGGDAAVIRSGANLPDLFASCRLCRVPAAAVRDMLNWVLFQLLIGNSDAHGKNISFFVGPSGIDMAPAYDLLNLDMYAAEYDRNFSMAIGDAFAPEDISPWELAEMCERCGLQKRLVAKTLTTMSEKLLKAVDEVDLSVLLTGEETEFAGELLDKVRKNVERYLPFTKQLPKIVV
ncbi:MAG: HipA domain-containing protein [Deltaproteobacteria bacterium]|jgi:serine/threonine-protein kinase HipA|nr:HipA domain-containing protein [Deltaproteobacteria bacterium]